MPPDSSKGRRYPAREMRCRPCEVRQSVEVHRGEGGSPVSSSTISLLCSSCVALVSRGQTDETSRRLALRYSCVSVLSDLLWLPSSISRMTGMALPRSSTTSSSNSRMKPKYEPGSEPSSMLMSECGRG